jgi:hypothetical protein
VLTNTSSQAPARLVRNLARAVFGLPQIPLPASRTADRELVERAPLNTTEQATYVGSYRLTWIGGPATYASYERTARVFSFNGRLWVQYKGEEAFPLLHQEAHQFVSRLGSVTFTFEKDQPPVLEIRSGPMLLRGRRR